MDRIQMPLIAAGLAIFLGAMRMNPGKYNFILIALGSIVTVSGIIWMLSGHQMSLVTVLVSVLVFIFCFISWDLALDAYKTGNIGEYIDFHILGAFWDDKKDDLGRIKIDENSTLNMDLSKGPIRFTPLVNCDYAGEVPITELAQSVFR